MRTIAYVDGFNLYYRLLKKRPDLRWLDPHRLIQEFVPPGHDLTQVNYYTARISERPDKPGAAARQAIYLKALAKISCQNPSRELSDKQTMDGTHRTATRAPRTISMVGTNPKIGAGHQK